VRPHDFVVPITQESSMDPYRSSQITDIFSHVAETARTDAEAARQVREALIASGILQVFSANDASDLLDLLEAGGEAALRARLQSLSVAELRQVLTTHGYDPENAFSRVRSATKLIDAIVAKAQAELEAETSPAPAVAWLL
jgi:hypothetical protein